MAKLKEMMGAKVTSLLITALMVQYVFFEFGEVVMIMGNTKIAKTELAYQVNTRVNRDGAIDGLRN
eukprot:3137986-Ditylum_brightwellii.AAC.1